ncbi:DUF4383 domain-containing protein [Actinokineospora xionganensis]|uniref:DUF4383 domain-containing protein n=1 Tax=Actinokineospora xionganensis TaxID=2684470 RepID=A0ABR7L3T3_9PSEU|nr:DUF4383 domain-containing protein [Actinokineospora xionganensis]MBC6447343.1 DUF4383 domain-containing protein [Actinokineospora xionganensis]
MSTRADIRTGSPNRVLGYAFGAVYLLVGLVGFTLTAGTGFAATAGPHLLFFEINPLHNLVHVAIGALLAGAAWRGAGTAKAANTTVGAVYLLVAVVGLFLVGNAGNLLALNHADNILHFASAAVLLGVGLTRR